MPARVLMPLPDTDFDTTEVAVPWKLLTEAGHQVTFATERAGTVPACDPLLLSGVLFGQLGAEPEPKQFYQALTRAPEFSNTLAWGDLDVSAFDALLLPGGHAPGMRQYLESATLQAKVVAFVKTGKPFAAICHGPLVLARAVDPATGRSVLHGRITACLPTYMERTAYWLTAWKLGRYYRTSPAYVEAEVRAAGAELRQGPFELLRRGTRDDDAPAYALVDGNYVSARWPGDAYLFTRRLLELLTPAA
ncbi:MAG: DJ-1/PfpI family protein [Myxococcus sp.]|nr:DJ-1/PfpI family protein [Myxococcus sp.]